MSEQLNSLLDDEQEQVVDAPEPEEGAGEAETEDQTEETIDQPDDDGEPAPQPPEVNHQFAEFRKKHGQELAAARAEAERKQQMFDNLFAKTVKGEINPYTNQPIETYEDVMAWAEEEERKRLDDAGLSPDFIEQAIASNPVIQQANAIIKHNQEIQMQIAADREVAEIQKMNPKIKSIEDLVAENKDNEAFNAMVKGGMPLSKAYAIVHKIPQKKQDSTKDHLKSVGGGGAGDAADLPGDVLQTYIDIGFSREEAAKHWRKEHKNEK